MDPSLHSSHAAHIVVKDEEYFLVFVFMTLIQNKQELNLTTEFQVLQKKLFLLDILYLEILLWRKGTNKANKKS